MALIKFNQDITLAFISANHQDVERVSFSAGEFAEFTIQEESYGFTLTSADGSHAPWLGRDVFNILPEGFQLYRFTKDVNLYFGIREHGQWIYDIGSRRYPKDIVHAFKILDDDPSSITMGYDYLHLQTPNGQTIPEVHENLIERIGVSSALLAKRSTNKAAKRVLEAYPAPVPGDKGVHCGAWSCPQNFNSLVVVRDCDVPSSLLDCSEAPVAYLCLAEGDGRRYNKLYYRCSFFGIPRKPVAKV